MAELRESMRLADNFTSIEQRKGDRYIRAFIASCIGCVGIHLYSHRLQGHIDKEFTDYRKTVSDEL